MGMLVRNRLEGQPQRMLFNQEIPIPIESVAGWKGIHVQECGEGLVSVGPFSPYFSDCDTSAVYFGERGQGESVNFVGHPIDRSVSLLTHYVREGVLVRLRIAQSLLPLGCYFKLFDTYRPLDVQQALFDAQYEKLSKEHPEWPEKKLDEETQKYVSLSSPNPALGTIHPSPHSTGGVVDLTIIRLSEEGQRLLQDLNTRKLDRRLRYPISDTELADYESVVSWIHTEAKRKKWARVLRDTVLENWLAQYRYFKEKAEIFHTHSQELDMGTSFDYFGSEAGIRYFEDLNKERSLNDREKEILRNRRLLYHVMKEAGFANYPEEWWHFSYGDNMWAAINHKLYTIYGGVTEMNNDNKTMEWARRGVFIDALSRVGKPKLFIPSLEIDPSKN